MNGTDPGGVRLARALGKWGLTALTINCVVGASILGPPGKVYALAVSLCLAELGSRMEGSGGQRVDAEIRLETSPRRKFAANDSK